MLTLYTVCSNAAPVCKLDAAADTWSTLASPPVAGAVVVVGGAAAGVAVAVADAPWVAVVAV